VSGDVEIQWRAIAAEDGAGWARLLLAVEESYGTQDIVGAEDLVEDLRDPYVDPERGTIAAFSGGSMIAYAGLRASPGVTGRHEMDLHGAVHPGQRGRGLGRRHRRCTRRATRATRSRCRPAAPQARVTPWRCSPPPATSRPAGSIS
jgi:mycothiol synthase